MWNVVDIWQSACYQNVLFPRLWEDWIGGHGFWHPVWDRFYGMSEVVRSFQTLNGSRWASGLIDSRLQASKLCNDFLAELSLCIFTSR